MKEISIKIAKEGFQNNLIDDLRKLSKLQHNSYNENKNRYPFNRRDSFVPLC